MTKKRTNNPQVTEPVVTEEVIPQEDVITQALVKSNITEQALQAMEENFLKLEINGIDDKAGYEEVNKARIMVKNTRVLTTKVCKSGREKAIQEQRDWISTEKRIVERCAKVEDALAAKQKVIDDIKEAEKLERETKEQQRLQERAVKLIGYGCNFDGSAYILGDIKISVLQVKSLDEFTYSQLLAGVETKFRENQEIKAREDALRAEAEERNKRILEEALAKEEEIKKKEADIAAREEAIRQAELKAKADAEALIRAREEEAKRRHEVQLAQIEKEAADRLKSRRSSLFSLGFSQQNDKLVFIGVDAINDDAIKAIPDNTWVEYLETISKKVAERKSQIEAERLAKEEQLKQDAVEAERKRVEAERMRIEAEEFAKRAEETRLAMMQPDVVKLDSYLNKLLEIPVPTFNDAHFAGLNGYIQKTLGQFVKHIQDKQPK